VRELSEIAASTDGAEPEALLSAAEPIFEALHWSGAYWEVTRQGARLLRLLAPRTHLFGGIEDRVPGEEVSFDRAPLLEAVVTSGTSRFFQESHAMPTSGACVPIRRCGLVTHVLTIVGADVGERDVVAVELLADQIAASLGRAEQQRALIERERLAAWGGFASEIAEEMRDSFAALVLASDRLAFPRTEAPEADPLEAVKSGTAKLRHVVDGLLRLAEPVVARMEVVGLRDVLLRAVAGADDLGRHDAEAVELETTADLPPVRADADLLRQAIEILLSERLHRGPADGRVAVRAEPEGPGVRISVEGTGPTSPTGLRVAVVRRSVEEMGGRFAIESSDRGASFSIWLRTEASEAGAP